MNKKTIIVSFLAVGVAAAILIGILFGWEKSLYGVIGLGAGLGALIGVSAGNSSAKKTDKYRDELIQKRASNKSNHNRS